MRKQYHFQPGTEPGLQDAWDVHRLIELAAGLQVRSIPIDEITAVDTVYWFDGDLHQPTVRSVIDHVRLIQEVDPKHPIILGADGRLMDGMHRVARAILEGRTEIDAVRFETDPQPDHRNCRARELDYGDLDKDDPDVDETSLPKFD